MLCTQKKKRLHALRSWECSLSYCGNVANNEPVCVRFNTIELVVINQIELWKCCQQFSFFNKVFVFVFIGQFLG